MSLTDDKTELRKVMRARRDDLAKAAPDAALRAAEALPIKALPAFATVSGYHALGSEMDPGPLIARFRALNALIALPVATDRASPLIFRAHEPDDPLVADGFGIPSPGPHAPELHPDLVIAPILAFDRQGGRLGQGAGHYDRTLALLRARKPVFVLGLAYAGQEEARLPTEPHDIPLDAILTESGYIPVR